MDKSYEAWVEMIKAGWAKEERKNARVKAKTDKAIARGEYRIDGEYKGRDGNTIRILTKVS